MAVGQKGVSTLDPSKWNQGLKPAVPWCFNFDPYPYVANAKLGNQPLMDARFGDRCARSQECLCGKLRRPFFCSVASCHTT